MILDVMLAGVDGCRKGWIVALAHSWPSQEPVRFEFCLDFNAVLDMTHACDAVAVDMPIGLPDGKEVRECDSCAREALKRQHSSIFLAPPRSFFKPRASPIFNPCTRRSEASERDCQCGASFPKCLKSIDFLRSESPATQACKIGSSSFILNSRGTVWPVRQFCLRNTWPKVCFSGSACWNS